MNTNYTLVKKAYILRKSSMFQSLDLEELLPIAHKMHPKNLPSNEVIFDIGEIGYSLYFIAAGSVSIRNEKEEEIAELTSGAMFGDEALFSSHQRGYCAESSSPVELLTLSKAELLTIIQEYPKIAIGFLEAYTKVTPFRAHRLAV